MSLTPQHITQQALAERFDIPGHIQVGAGRHGMIRLALTSELGEAEIYLHGAHLTHWQPRGTDPVLFLSEASHFDPAKPIRGGVPICLPWFGPHASGADDAPSHGLARINPWQLVHTERDDQGGLIVSLAFDFSPDLSRHSPGIGQCRFTVRLHQSLSMSLSVRNAGPQPMSYEEALHTYFRVGNVGHCTVHGTEHTEFIDKTQNGARLRQDDAPLGFDRETDRVYQGTEADCVLDDPELNRRIRVSKRGSRSTVIWNPWIAKAARMPDFGDEEWPGMLCIESGNVAEQAVTLEPDHEHELCVTLSCASRS